jgi:hypothetical protein
MQRPAARVAPSFQPVVLLSKMCADIVTITDSGLAPCFRFPHKNGIVRQSLHGSISEKKQFVNNK